MDGEERFIYSDDELAKIVKEEEKRLGKELDIHKESDKAVVPDATKSLDMVEFYVSRELDKIIAELQKAGMDIEDYSPAPEETIGKKKTRAAKGKRAEKKGVEQKTLFKVKYEDEIKEIASLKELLELAKTIGKHGMTIQRYKGLGEMNPDQLWETTMDPERRTLLKVMLEDAVEADAMFTVLMGDQVEPRRKFIEKHAPEVRNLDV